MTNAPTISPNLESDTRMSLYFIIIMLFVIILSLFCIKCIYHNRHTNIEATFYTIEIPIAVSISIQTVDNDHIGTVI